MKQGIFKRLSKPWTLMVVAVFVLAVAACGGDDPATPTTGTGGGDPTATPSGGAPTSTPNSGQNGGGNGDIDDIPFTTDRDMTLNGAGATFPFVLYSQFAESYNQLNSGLQVNYSSIGSGGGIRQVIEKTVDFGGTDGPMNDEQKEQAGSRVLHVPIAMGSVVPAYNLPGNPQVRFTSETIAGIFLGDITNWNDPRLAEDNPDVELPDRNIAVIHRSDGSGTTFIWVDYLSNVSEEWNSEVGTATSVQWPTGIGANGNEGVANQIRQIPGAVGYVELAYATQNDLAVGHLQNREGNFIEPNLESVSAAAGGMIAAGEFPENMEARVVDAPGEDSFPAAGFTWYLIYQELNVLQQMNLERAQELIRYTLWSLDQEGGQQYHADLDYAPLDPLVIDMAKEALKTVTFNGEPVWETMLP
ncbi:MAG: phosphate ABC transporter substrate-binding protein PstS [Dehalococcoidia bacterium]